MIWGNWFKRVESTYSLWLEKAVDHRKIVFVSTAALLIATILLCPLIPVELAPQTDADEIDVELEMAQGTNIAVVQEYLTDLEYLVREVTPMDQVKHMSVEIRPGDAEVELSLKSAGEREINSFELADKIRKHVAGKIPGAEVRVSAQSGLWMLRRLFGSGGAEAIQLELRGYDLEFADKIALDIEKIIRQVPEVEDVRISRREGRPEQNLIIDREKIAKLGLTVRQVAEVIQTNIGGSRAGVFREGGDEFPIIVRLRPNDRLSTLDLKNVSLRTTFGRNCSCVLSS